VEFEEGVEGLAGEGGFAFGDGGDGGGFRFSGLFEPDAEAGGAADVGLVERR
jgi:hypothetical protein